MHRGDIEDLAAAARGLAPTDERAATEERAIEVRLDDAVEFLGRHLGHAGPATAHSRIVDQDVGCAELATGGIEQGSDARFIPNIELPHHGLPARRLHPAATFLGAGLVRVECEDDVRASARELLGHGLAHPKSGPVIRAIFLSSFAICSRLRTVDPIRQEDGVHGRACALARRYADAFDAKIRSANAGLECRRWIADHTASIPGWRSATPSRIE